MRNIRILSSSEQVAAHLRGELENRTWSGMMPGGDLLARELGVGANTMEAALKLLELEGWLENRGRRRGRKIILQPRESGKGKIRITVLLGETSDRDQASILDLVNALEDEGHSAKFASKTQEELKDSVELISRCVGESAADAWIVYSATKDVLQWFAESDIPSFALAGRANRIALPSIAPDKITPLRTCLRRLVGLGHRRIVMLCRPMRRIPEPGLFERAFLKEMEALGISTGKYNLPDWEENTGDFHRVLDSLFGVTPPTALLIDEAPFVTATFQFCMRRGLDVPKDFSLICTDSDPSFAWSTPSISHIKWDRRPILKRIVQWADNIARGKKDQQKGFSNAELIEGGTIGPAPGA
ncbi:substrate-binding domain-containing protein [Akkermansiaceae bacterium]|nr:substrate-binding domain-containing protein [Akkermansiaceae bacterium]